MRTKQEQLKELASVTLCHFFDDYKSMLLPIIMKKFNISIVDVLNISEVNHKYWDHGYIEDTCIEWLNDDVLDSMEDGDIQSGDLQYYMYKHKKELQNKVIEYLEDNSENDF